MGISISFVRLFFLCLSVFIVSGYLTIILGWSSFNLMLGVVLGGAFGLLLIGLDVLFKRVNLRSFNTAILGSLLGWLMGKVLVLIFSSAVKLSAFEVNPLIIDFVETSIFLFCTYMGIILTFRASQDLYFSIPFIRFKAIHHKRKDVLIDISALQDPRVIDLASSGLLDQQLILPRFLVKECSEKEDSSFDEQEKNRFKRALESIRKLENLSDLSLRYVDLDFADLSDSSQKTIQLAKFLDTHLLVSDATDLPKVPMDGIRVISLKALCTHLQPMAQNGETMLIKVQRPGKEPGQGIGYRDDGTMVVINGGGDYIGKTIKAQVLITRKTTSGMMIFCNAVQEGGEFPTNRDIDQSLSEIRSVHKNYFST